MSYKFGTAGPVSTTIATITAGAGQTSFTVSSAAGLPTLAAGDSMSARIADGTGSAENIRVTAISGTTITCLATTVSHAAGNAIDFDVLSAVAIVGLMDNAISGGAEVVLTAAGALGSVPGALDRIVITTAATFPLANGTYKGEIRRIMNDEASTKLATVDPAGITTINGALTRVLAPGETLCVAWSGAQWEKLFGRFVPMVARAATFDTISAVTGTDTKLTFTAVGEDATGAMVDVATDRITIARPGIYSLQAIAQWVALGAVSGCYVYLYKNGAPLLPEGYAYGFASSYPIASRELVVRLIAGDYVEVFSKHFVGANTGTYAMAFSATELPSW